jgi:Lanthionine synthetase C-like protein
VTELYDPAEHRPLGGHEWSEAAARDAIAQIAGDAVAAYRGPAQLWPNHPLDLEDDDPDVPYRNAYFGAAGMAWALHRLAEDDLGPELPGVAELVAVLPGDYRDAPELTELATGVPPPAPSLLFGESGVLLACEAIAPDAGRRDKLAACVARNAENPTRELCWGSPGTMVAALAMWRATGEERWRELWERSARWLLDEWRETVWVQDMYGSQARYVGAGHGFASNAMVLLAGACRQTQRGLAFVDQHVVERVAATLSELAVVDGDVAQWPGLADTEIERKPVQWCHGSPGIVSSLRALPADPETDALLTAGAELTWRAGALRKGVGLCHGTAGNAFALLALYARTGDERWLERARAFAMDAAADVSQRRKQDRRGRYSLFTGDVGAALLLRACLDGDPRVPFLEDALSAS